MSHYSREGSWEQSSSSSSRRDSHSRSYSNDYNSSNRGGGERGHYKSSSRRRDEGDVWKGEGGREHRGRSYQDEQKSSESRSGAHVSSSKSNDSYVDEFCEKVFNQIKESGTFDECRTLVCEYFTSDREEIRQLKDEALPRVRHIVEKAGQKQVRFADVKKQLHMTPSSTLGGTILSAVKSALFSQHSDVGVPQVLELVKRHVKASAAEVMEREGENREEEPKQEKEKAKGWRQSGSESDSGFEEDEELFQKKQKMEIEQLMILKSSTIEEVLKKERQRSLSQGQPTLGSAGDTLMAESDSTPSVRTDALNGSNPPTLPQSSVSTSAPVKGVRRKHVTAPRHSSSSSSSSSSSDSDSDSDSDSSSDSGDSTNSSDSSSNSNSSSSSSNSNSDASDSDSSSDSDSDSSSALNRTNQKSQKKKTGTRKELEKPTGKKRDDMPKRSDRMKMVVENQKSEEGGSKAVNGKEEKTLSSKSSKSRIESPEPEPEMVLRKSRTGRTIRATPKMMDSGLLKATEVSDSEKEKVSSSSKLAKITRNTKALSNPPTRRKMRQGVMESDGAESEEQKINSANNMSEADSVNETVANGDELLLSPLEKTKRRQTITEASSKEGVEIEDETASRPRRGQRRQSTNEAEGDVSKGQEEETNLRRSGRKRKTISEDATTTPLEGAVDDDALDDTDEKRSSSRRLTRSLISKSSEGKSAEESQEGLRRSDGGEEKKEGRSLRKRSGTPQEESQPPSKRPRRGK